jgi:hypothetical protein
MRQRDAMQAAFHGAVMLALGLLVGFPLTGSVAEGGDAAVAHGWRVAHDTLLLFGVLLLAVAAVGPQLVLSARASWLLLASLAVSVYASAVPLIVGPVTGTPGLRPGASPLALFLFVCLLVALVELFLAAALLLRGTWAAWRTAE